MDNEWVNVESALERAVSAANKLYAERGFGKPYGFGKKPSLVMINLANAMNNQIILGV